MKNLGFLCTSAFVILSMASCTKDDVQQNATPVYENNDPYAPMTYSVSFSSWNDDENLIWADGTTSTDPNRISEWAAPELSQAAIDSGSVVLVFAKSSIDNSVISMPAVYSDVAGDTVHAYHAFPTAGSILLTHTKMTSGVFEVPNDANNISFRYIIVNPHTPDPLARELTINNFSTMNYHDVINLLSIPE